MTTRDAPFLASLTDTAATIEQLRAQLADVEKRRGELETQANDLKVRIDAFNTLRQAHGLAPL